MYMCSTCCSLYSARLRLVCKLLLLAGFLLLAASQNRRLDAAAQLGLQLLCGREAGHGIVVSPNAQVALAKQEVDIGLVRRVSDEWFERGNGLLEGG